ncbi:unnamed protein product [Durusdinium trenchii]|uniref:Uncharacterized protein n=1 Tax=Durusdinium trenchii TaxID=1381693 RepID=A0ABP0RQF6_9DINO
MDGGLYWLSTGIQLTYKHLPAIYALSPTLIVLGEALQLNISGALTFAGEVISLQAPPLHPLPSKVESIYGPMQINETATPLMLEPEDTSADPAQWMMTPGSNFTLSRPFWNCGPQVVEAGLGQEWFYCSGLDGTIRVVEQSTGCLLYAVASVSGNTTRVIGMPSEQELLVLDGNEVLLWQLGEKASKETPPPLPQLECRLLNDKFVSEVMTGRRSSKDEASCDLPKDLKFHRLGQNLPAATYPVMSSADSVDQEAQGPNDYRRAEFVTPVGQQMLQVREGPKQRRAERAVNLVTETFEGLRPA